MIYKYEESFYGRHTLNTRCGEGTISNKVTPGNKECIKERKSESRFYWDSSYDNNVVGRLAYVPRPSTGLREAIFPRYQDGLNPSKIKTAL